MSVNSYKFRKGRAVLKKTRELPKTTFTVPQKDGSKAPIVLLEPTEAKKTLGIETSTSGSGKIHLQSIREKGLDWTDKLRSNRYIRPREGWLSCGNWCDLFRVFLWPVLGYL